MESNATEGQVADVVAAITAAGFSVRRTGMERVVLGVSGVGRSPEPELIDGLPGIAEVSVSGSEYRLVSRGFQPEDSQIDVGNEIIVGGERIVVMAGPCSVEDEDTVNRVAEAVAKAGAHILRGGAYKPRTSPYSFQGLGEEGLYLLRQAADANGLLTISEVMEPSQIPLAAHYCDVLQIGARNMQNFTLLRELGRPRRPVMLKRGPASTMEEWLAAAEYIASCGNPDILLCERGIRTFETATRNTFDLSAIPVAKSRSHLPVVADPSHGTGVREHVLPMARAAIAAGADAIMVEVHVEPEKALSDGAQSLTPPMFEKKYSIFGEPFGSLRRTRCILQADGASFPWPLCSQLVDMEWVTPIRFRRFGPV
jgi:3-deoxy-7-phosphoheptulonate synthase